jgi:hypothetical protein
MAKIEAHRRDVPLYEVVKHIAGGDPECVFIPSDDDEEGLEVSVSEDAVKEDWDRALEQLIDAVGASKLKVRGRRAGSEWLEEVKSGDFAEVADNPFASRDFGNEFSGKRVLEFDADHRAIILRCHSNGASELLCADLCADSGAEVLKLWPSLSATSQGLNARKREAAIRAIAEISASTVQFATVKERENAIVKLVLQKNRLTITDRYIRDIEFETRNGRRS